jgi:hypothetical protein
VLANTGESPAYPGIVPAGGTWYEGRRERLRVTTNDFNLNRPIHLARRDVHFERAVELLYMPIHELDTNARIRHVEKVLSLLKTSQHHAFLATKSAGTTQAEQDFLRFLNLISHNVQSAHAMMQHQTHLEGEEGFLCQFLSASQEECALPALHYRRRADDILQGVWHLLRLAHRPYRELQHGNSSQLSPQELARYRRAYDSFHTEVNERFAAEPLPQPAETTT